MGESSNVVLELKGISKSFQGNRVLHDLNWQLKSGEVHALVGENGAGKSTLIKIVCGVYTSDSGEILYHNHPVKWHSPLEARNSGISVIHQELNLARNLTVAENVLMGADVPKNRFGVIKWDGIYLEAKKLLNSIGSDLSPKRLVSTLSVAQQQIVEIARALSIKADVIIMDEPTATLTDKEIDKLFELIELLKSRGVAIVYVSHRMEEIFRIADRCTVLRDGRMIKTMNTKDTNVNELVSLMVGRELSDVTHSKKDNAVVAEGIPALEVLNVSDGKAVRNASLKVYAGEIVGISGLVGAGRSELLHAIFGSSKMVRGEIRLNGEKVDIKSPRMAIAKGVGLVPESRKEQSLFLDMAVEENVSVLKQGEFSTFGWIKRTQMQNLQREYIERLNVKTATGSTLIKNLSGGNQQKAIIARWLTISPKVLLLDEPTRGVDVGAKAEIYEIIWGLAKQGMAVVVVSSDLPEILTLSNRVYVMRQGEIVHELQGEGMNQETIMMYATGGATA